MTNRRSRRVLFLMVAAAAFSSMTVVASEAPAGAIKGGTPVASISSRPYVVALYGGTLATLCTGVLIRPAWVLTAGHCVANALTKPANESVYAGNTKPGLNALVHRTHALAVQKVYRQLGWAKVGADAFVNDIGLVHLAHPLSTPLVAMTQPSDALVWDPCGTTRTSTGCTVEDVNVVPPKTVTAVGFGLTCANPLNCSTSEGYMRSATLNVLSYAQLRLAYPSTPYSGVVNAAHDKMVVGAGVPTGAADTCGGDSGAPLLALMHDGHWRVVAITSWATGGCGASPPNGVYMQIGAGPARTWINSIIVNP